MRRVTKSSEMTEQKRSGCEVQLRMTQIILSRRDTKSSWEYTPKEDMLLYKVTTSEELLEQYDDCIKRNTYYASYIPKGECTIYDLRFSPAIGYYIESKDYSFLENSMFSYDYFKQEYLVSAWYSSKEDDELQDTRRLKEISGIGINKYIERYNDFGICY